MTYILIGLGILVFLFVAGMVWQRSRYYREYTSRRWTTREVNGKKIHIEADDFAADVIAETLRTGKPTWAKRGPNGEVTIGTVGDDE